MICTQLIGLNNLTETALLLGDRMDEHKVRPQCQFSIDALRLLRRGKELSIEHMMAGGDGFPYGHVSSEIEMGCAQERRDIQRLAKWEFSLQECLIERQRQSANRIK